MFGSHPIPARTLRASPASPPALANARFTAATPPRSSRCGSQPGQANAFSDDPRDRLAAMVNHWLMDGSRELWGGSTRNGRACLYRAIVALAACLALISWAGPTSALTGVPTGGAPVAPRPLQPGDALPAAMGLAPRISVLTFGPGSETFSKFGHDAVWVHDGRQPLSRRDLVFNYGTFRFDSPWLILDFLKGKLRYWLSATTLERTLATYRAANRSVTAQELELTPEAALAITAFLHENVKPENAYYSYDYYRDNCATRIRDLLDQHLDHQLRDASSAPAPLTWREHTRRLTLDSPVLFLALDLAMGPLIDRPRTEWEDMFLPARVEAKLAQLSTATGQPLVKRQVELVRADRPPVPEDAPGFQWPWLALGCIAGGTLYGLSRAGRRWADVALGLGVGTVGALTGILALLLLVLWLLTDHDVTYWNQNLLLCPPWALAIASLGVDLGRARPRHLRLMMQLVGAAASSACVALLLRLVVPGNQETAPALALFVPLWLGVGGAVWERYGRPMPRFLAARVRGVPGHEDAPPEVPGV